MTLLNKEVFICFDIEATGLDPKNDRIVEIAIVKFTFDEVLASFESLIDPEISISPESVSIHHITNEMVQGKPKIQEVLPEVLQLIGQNILVGHGISYDVNILAEAAKRNCIPCHIEKNKRIDTLRLARLYGESPTNSLEVLRNHFNIPAEGAHRAMSDVIVNIEVFKYLTKKFRQTKEVLERLQRPILLKAMPLGKHKGRGFGEIPVEYLRWAIHQDFDQDLIFSLKNELKKRKQGTPFTQSASPFQGL
jgi:DNA polymerase-3 subunit epsilon